MLRVLIADDEKKIGLLVKNLVQWEELGLEFLGIVQDGLEAYEIIMKKAPDIVITDIRMPSLSGLEMIEKVTEAGLSVHFIVISGYRYFEYAQTALKYGVRDYLLKPIDEDELNKILAKVCEDEKKNRGLQKHVKALEANLQNSKHILHRELMERAFEHQKVQNMDTVEKEREDLGIGLFQAVGIKVDREILDSRNEEQENLICSKLAEMVNDSLKPAVLDLVISIRKGMWILVLMNFTDESRKMVRENLTNFFYKTKNYIGGFENYEVTMGISPETRAFSQINMILEMAGEAVRCRIFEGSGISISSYSENRNRSVKGQEIIEKYSDEMEKYIQIFQCDKLSRLIRDMFYEADQNQIMACEYYQMIQSLGILYCQKISNLFHQNMEEFLLLWKENIESLNTVSAMKRYVIEKIKKHLSALEKHQTELERKPILDTIEYVKNNYGQKILLEEMAEKIGFNPNYFSEVFKKETGKNFSTYLLEVRMDAAKDFLRNNSETIYKIASKVGYKDSKYFSQQFTKVVGIKPTEYRRLYF